MLKFFASGLFVFVYWLSPWQKDPEGALPAVPARHFAACDLIVDAGPDTNVCDPGGMIGLMGSITGNSLFFQWTPATGLNNPLILNPLANVTTPVTYTLTAYGIDPSNPNLVTNGDFQTGNTGFSTDYTYVADIPGLQNEMVPEGTYTVINNPNLVHTGFSACNDHTGGGGNMMVVNGAASLQDIWCQTISVTPNTWYDVSAWVASVNPASPAKLRFSINGTPIGSIIDAPSTTCQWIPFNATWNSGSNTSATICILNLNTALGGNDFALDDISMVSLCAVEDEVFISLYEEEAPEPVIEGLTFVCEGDIATYTATFPPLPPILSYQWLLPSGATIMNGQGTTEVTVMWEEAQDASLCLLIETRCDMNESCYEVTVGTLPQLPLITGPVELCPGETATLYTPELDPDDTYQWFLPSEVVLVSGEGTNEIEIEWANAGDAEICLEVTNACGTTDNCTFLTLLPDYLTFFDTILCQGTTVVINGNIYGNGVWTGTENFTSVNGCDSLVQVDITEATTLEFMFTENLCPGDSIFLEGAFHNQPGIYVDSFTTVSGCDSIVITELTISPFDTTWITSFTCNPGEVNTTIITYSQGNCDSTVISQVLLLSSDTTYISLTSCSPADTSHVMQWFTNQAGCDSLVITSTSLLPSDTLLFFQTTCDPSSAGVTTQSFINSSGCDSTIITTVAFQESDTTLISLWTCTAADTGMTSTVYVNSQGCDSLVITQATYGGSDTTYLSFTSCEPQDTGIFTSYLFNEYGCDSIVITETELLPAGICEFDVAFYYLEPNCHDDTAILHVEVLTGFPTYSLLWESDLGTIIFDYIDTPSFDVPIPVQGINNFTLSSMHGHSQFVTLDVIFPPPLQASILQTTDYNGYAIRCHGDSSAGIQLELLSGGTPPLQVQWSDGNSQVVNDHLPAGNYSVTVTDSHGCIASDSIILFEPPLMNYEVSFSPVSCFGLFDGEIMLSQLAGGVGSWMTSLDFGLFDDIFSYHGLGAGDHVLTLTDQNGCTAEESFTFIEPENWTVELGADTTLSYGSVFEIKVDIQGTYAGTLSAVWSDAQCENCLSRTIETLNDIRYKVIATDENGCTSEDEIHIDVIIERDLFVPNVFSPNEDGINDLFIISSGAGLAEIEELSIFDRWGNLVFQSFHFAPDDPSAAWDGKMNEQYLNPGVYAYKLIAVFKDQQKEFRFGDITLIR